MQDGAAADKPPRNGEGGRGAPLASLSYNVRGRSECI